MCGICGTAGFADRNCLEAMNNAIIHRGPDDGGIEIIESPVSIVGLANRRLSIIDLSSAGHQPMCNEDHDIWITYNGEIYNFQALKRQLEQKGHRFKSNTDTEVLIHLYEERGMRFLDDLNGMFAFALWDVKRQQLILARDPYGMKPLYYMPLENGQLAFGSEIKSFIAGKILKPELNTSALSSFLNFLWVPGPDTMFKGIYKLNPGHSLIWKPTGEYTIQQYWDGTPSPSAINQRSESELIEEARSLLINAVKSHLVSDVPLGVFLSGGLDSSSILALATRLTNRSMKAYTISFRSEDSLYEQSDEDKHYARVVARRFDADHHEIEIAPNIVDLLPKIVRHMDEPIADPASITSYLISKAAREELTVLLSGQGGDEIFGGYRVHLMDRLSHPFEFIPKGIRDNALLPMVNMLPEFQSKIPGVRPGKILAIHRYAKKLLAGIQYNRSNRYVYHRSYYAPDEQGSLYSKEFSAHVTSLDAYQSHLKYLAQVSNLNFVDQMLFLDQKTFLPELNLAYSDKTSMAASIETRLPLLDQELTRFVRHIPPKYKINGYQQKYIFKRAMEGILPKEVIYRGKAPFGAPIRKWLNIDLKPMVEDLLSAETIKKREIFNPVAIRQILDENMKGKQDHTFHIWALLTLEIWMRMYIDQSEGIPGKIL